MQISVTEAKSELTGLVRRAEAGDEVILTRHSQAVVRLVPVKAVPTGEARRTLLSAVRAAGAAKASAGPNAARSQTSFTAITACLNDRSRHISADGRHAE